MVVDFGVYCVSEQAKRKCHTARDGEQSVSYAK